MSFMPDSWFQRGGLDSGGIVVVIIYHVSVRDTCFHEQCWGLE